MSMRSRILDKKHIDLLKKEYTLTKHKHFTKQTATKQVYII